jgi:hypothetical protein
MSPDRFEHVREAVFWCCVAVLVLMALSKLWAWTGWQVYIP